MRTFFIKNEALKLKGVQHLKINLNENEKLKFVSELFTQFDGSLVFIFVNKKKTALAI